MNRILMLIAVVLTPSFYILCKPIPAVCIVPVADLLSQKLSFTGRYTVEEQYAQLPLSEKEPVCLCSRATQLLFNERVVIIEQSNEQSYVETSFWHVKKASFQSPSTQNNRFWTLTKNLKPLSTLSPLARATSAPANSENFAEKIITLILPWYCSKTAMNYSAGTQFIATGENNSDYQIKLYHSKTSSVVENKLPKSMCVLTKKRTNEEKRELFLKTVQQWAHGIPDRIPYVLGGASIVETFKQTSFSEKKITNGKIKSTGFIRPECTTTPHTGVDCAGLIRLGCKVAGIPLTAINSKSIAQSLCKLAPTTTLCDGDLIFWKGHIALISDSKKGLLVEARGYEHGYGLVQEIPYFLELQGIITTNNLMNAYTTKKPIVRIDKKGSYRQTITDFAVFSLFSVKPTACIK